MGSGTARRSDHVGPGELRSNNREPEEVPYRRLLRPALLLLLREEQQSMPALASVVRTVRGILNRHRSNGGG